MPGVTPIFEREEINRLRRVNAIDYQRFLATIDDRDATIADLEGRLDGLRERLLTNERSPE